jgi:dipeptidyl aminopeptidase/acylaminoacyl peptidase
VTGLRLRIAGCVLATLTGPWAFAGTPFTLDDFYQLADVTEPTFSPSGDHIAYIVSRNDKKADESNSDIWSVPWKGGKPVQLTRTPKHSESQPRYASDGKSLYFLSDAGKKDDDDE